MTGYTESDDFPSTIDAYQAAIGLSHHDGFLAKLDSDGAALVYATFFGSNGPTNPAGVAVDADGNAYVTGRTFAGNVPVTPGARGWSGNGQGDGFLVRFDAAGAQPDVRRPTSAVRPPTRPPASPSTAAATRS